MTNAADSAPAVQLYTGDGKGKTTACFGLALRARGRGLRVAVVQFLKSGASGEVGPARQAGVRVEVYGRSGFVDPAAPTAEDRRLAKQGWERLVELAGGGDYDLVIGDELLVALDLGLLELEAVLALLERRPPVELVFSGRGAPPELVARADLVSEILAVKHYHHQGRPARPGIEY
jgi:cob(I)alamin adenosyltransferase